MKKVLLTALVAATAGIAMNTFAAPVTVNGGQIHFQGEVVDAACSVSANSVDQTVILDQVRVKQFTGANAEANQKKQFNIDLSDCDTSVQSKVSFTFTGNQVAGSPDLLQNTAGAGAAQNVALRLYDHAGNVIPVDGSTPSTQMNLIDGNNSVPMAVDYVSTSAVPTTGPVAATATFHVNYN